jgi:Predicted nucleic acid-binding protein, contains PIN domain
MTTLVQRSLLGIQMEVDDVMVAVIAVSSGMTLVTKRSQHYAVFPNLRLEDWTV